MLEYVLSVQFPSCEMVICLKVHINQKTFPEKFLTIFKLPVQFAMKHLFFVFSLHTFRVFQKQKLLKQIIILQEHFGIVKISPSFC